MKLVLFVTQFGQRHPRNRVRYEVSCTGGSSGKGTGQAKG